MKAAEARALIGKGVVECDVDSGIWPIRCGEVEEVKGKNILINGEWRWLPDLKNLRLRR